MAAPPTERLSRPGKVLSVGTASRRLTISANGAGVTDSRLLQGVRVSGAGVRGVVEFSEVSSSANGLSGNALVVNHSKVSSQVDGINPTGSPRSPVTLIEYNKIWRDGTRVGKNHHDGIQLWQGGNTVIRRNWVSGWDTAAINLKSSREARPGDGPIKDVMIEENYLSNPSGHFIIYVRRTALGRPQMVTIRNNVLGEGSPINTANAEQESAVFVRTEAERQRAILAGDESAREWIVWYGNVDAVTSADIPPPGGWRS